MKILFTCRAFAVLYLPGHRREFLPCLGRRIIAILFQQIGAIEEKSGVGIHGYRNELVANRIVLNDAREVGRDLVVFVVLLQINGMRGRDPLPNHVDQVNVHVRTFRDPILLIQRQGRRSVIGPADIFELVARFLCPFFGYGPVPTSVLTTLRLGS